MATGQVALSRHRTPITIQKSRPAVPAFLQKLHEMVNDPNNHELIRWSDAGDSFFVMDHERFAREVLGRWFKHQNFASFVRQLNMYGFHKIPHLQQGVLKSDADSEFWNFGHPNFHRGQPELLCLIQRKKQAPQGGEESVFEIREPTHAVPTPAGAASGQVLDIQTIMNGISAIQRHQSTIAAELNELKQSNQLLWQDAMDARAKHQKQQDTINRIVRFLAGVFGNHTDAHKESSVEPIPSRAVVPRRAPRFLIEDGRRNRKVIVEDELDASERELGHPLDSDFSPIVETPHSAPSPTPSETLSLPASYFNSQQNSNGISQPFLSTSNPTMNDNPFGTPRTETGSQSSEHPANLERSVTPTKPAAPAHPEFDPRIQVVLNQLTPAQISQLLSSISHSLDPPPTDGHNPTPVASSQITQYTPPLTDLFSQFISPQPPSSAPLDKIENLLSFTEDDHANPISKSWKSVHDIQGEVDVINADIETFARSLGLEYDHDKDTTTSNFVPTLSAPPPPMASTAVPIIPSPSLRVHTGGEDAHMGLPGPESNSDHSPRPSPSNSLFDIESLFGFQDTGGVPGIGEAFGDLGGEIQPGPPQSQSQHPLPILALPQETSMGPPATQELSPGSKRKLDLADMADMASPAATSEATTPPLSSSMPATRSSKRRKR